MADTQSRKWQLTLNNPADKGLDHDEIKHRLDQLKSAVYWCMADEIGLDTQTPHTHIYVQLRSPARFSRIKKLFPDAHIEQARGSATENKVYVEKSGKWADDAKADTCVPGTFEEWGELPDEQQGHRSDLDEIAAMLDDGMTPAEIMATNFAYRRYERMIKGAFFDKRRRETPVKRDVQVHYLVGESGSGKSYIYVQLCEEHGEDDCYIVSDYSAAGGWDDYCGQSFVVLDELKGQVPFSTLLQWLDVYKIQIHARYSNVYSLWEHVYITSVFPPEELYRKMVEEGRRGLDKQQQLFRRITDITYCYVDDNGEYQRYTIPMSQYKDYKTFKEEATTPDWVKEAEEADDYDQLPL